MEHHGVDLLLCQPDTTVQGVVVLALVHLARKQRIATILSYCNVQRITEPPLELDDLEPTGWYVEVHAWTHTIKKDLLNGRKPSQLSLSSLRSR